jgi:hypothetical protein
MGSWALVAVTVALVLWVRGLLLLASLPRHKRPDVPWGMVHPRAEAHHHFIVMSPDSLTDEGRRKLLSATRSFGLCACVVIGSLAINMATSHAF